ncbi:MAG: GAF domain-containing sensor histidine kinase [bacterium]|nr:GAF domain-containing sensor histidine kinase [bacterium]
MKPDRPMGSRAAVAATLQVAKSGIAAHEALFETYDRMIGDVDIPVVLREVAGIVCSDMNAERTTVYLLDSATERLNSIAVIGNVERTIKVPIRPSSLAGYCALSGRAFVVPDAYSDLSGISPELEFDRSWDEINGFHTRDVLCAPAMFKGDVVGVVQVINSKGEPFRDADLLQLTSVARLVGYAIYHARLYDDLASLKRLDQEKAQFMRVLVHELKSPAAATKMMTELLQDQKDLPETVTHLHDRVAARMDEMLELISEILVLAKVKSGEAMSEIVALDLAALTGEVCEQYRPQADQKGVRLSLDLPAEPLNIRIDVKGCNLVLSNLISNAVKYTREGEVMVSLKCLEGWAELEVRDSGIGIPEKDIPHLFKEFFRATNASKHGIPGSGVGLASIKNIVERFDGQLALESVENVGSTFIVRLPIFEE